MKDLCVALDAEYLSGQQGSPQLWKLQLVRYPFRKHELRELCIPQQSDSRHFVHMRVGS
jgi:hypothetical protein